LCLFRNAGNKSDIFTTKYVQDLLNYKMQQSKEVSYALAIYFMAQLYYLTIYPDKDVV